MKAWVTRILTVQQCDMKLRSLEVKYKTIPGERAKLKEEYLAAKQRVADAEAELKRLELDMKQSEGESASLGEKQKKALTQSALVKKQTEYQALMDEIAHLKEQVSAVETRILELMDALEAARKKLQEEQKNFSLTERRIRQELAEFEELIGHIKEEVLRIRSEKKNFSKTVEMRVMEAYTNILTRDSGEPVVPIVNGACRHCLIKVTPQCANEAKKGTMVFCDNCSHMLYDPDAVE